jgi:hypothetical protein
LYSFSTWQVQVLVHQFTLTRRRIMLTHGILPQAMHLRILQPNKANQKVMGCQKQKLLVSQLEFNPGNRRKRLESKLLYSFFSIFIDG